jgi:thymidylate synthase (FAD)
MKNTVELLGYYGSDETIACSAWTSTSRELTEDKKGRISKLINMLVSEGHHTPLEKGIVHFLVNSDIASHIHLLKHRINVSINSESARYKELKEDKYYIPEDWKGVVSKTDFFLIDNDKIPLFSREQEWQKILQDYTDLGNMLYHECLEDLTPTLGRKRAKESARFFKTYNSQIQCDVMFNIRSFMNFQKLRNNEHAQVEIREIAQKMLDLVKSIEGSPFKLTLEAFNCV